MNKVYQLLSGLFVGLIFFIIAPYLIYGNFGIIGFDKFGGLFLESGFITVIVYSMVVGAVVLFVNWKKNNFVRNSLLSGLFWGLGFYIAYLVLVFWGALTFVNWG